MFFKSLFYKVSVARHELFELKEFTYVNDFNSNPDNYREVTKLMDFIDKLYISGNKISPKITMLSLFQLLFESLKYPT